MKCWTGWLRGEGGSSAIEVALLLSLLAVPMVLGTYSVAKSTIGKQRVEERAHMVALAIANDPTLYSDAARLQSLLARASYNGITPSVSQVCYCAKTRNSAGVSCTGNPCAGSPAAQYVQVSIATSASSGIMGNGNASMVVTGQASDVQSASLLARTR